MNGIDLAKEIRRLHPGLPVVLTSGYSHVLAQEGTHGFELLQKPYSADDLSRVFRRVTSRRPHPTPLPTERSAPMLTRRILALVALALAPALAIQGYNEYALRTSRDAAVRADALGTARTVAADLGQLAQSLRQVLDLVGNEEAVRRKDAGACTAYLGAIIDRLPQLSLLSVAEPDGRVVCDSRGSTPGLYSNAERAYHKRVLASDDFAVGDFVIGVRTRQPAVHFAQPVRGYDDRLTGVVVASVDLARLSERLQADLRFASTTLTVTDPEGTVLVRRPDHAAWVGRKLSGERLARLMRADETTRSVEGLDGRARIVGIAKPDGALAGFNVIVGRDRETAFADIDAATYRGIAVILLGALLAVLATLLAGRRFIERPVRRLLRGVAAWQGGDLDARTGMSGPRSSTAWARRSTPWPRRFRAGRMTCTARSPGDGGCRSSRRRCCTS